ncbi:hypothetical protein [Cloacibacillus sp. An23]|uniref:hypothetical protein n=1 Tax=Cloacibacillus sp. An23 TaxID=1965591 RepID=UPI000B367E82|nr:hypothetical protein [Cloacibacillus sp. An23]OUO93087.1 hypothetical protein B5F39_09600 [Cloacibacillus sp. An23]
MKYPNMTVNIFVRRHMQDGSMTVVPCTMSLLPPEEADDAVRIHDEVAHGLSEDIFIPSSREEIERYLGPEGLAVGIKHEGRLISLRTAITGEDWVRYTANGMGLPPGEAENAACTGFCVVHREFRGNNVQFLSQYYAENLIASHRDAILTTVSPHNIFSLQNVLNCNYRIVALNEIYGGHLRYVLKKEFRSEFPLWTHWHMQIPIRDIERQRRALAAGAVGYKLVRKPSGMHVLYAAASRTPCSAKDLRID